MLLIGGGKGGEQFLKLVKLDSKLRLCVLNIAGKNYLLCNQSMKKESLL